MIIVKMMGNIGNQLFIYAMARRLQLQYNDKLIIDLSGLKRNYYTAKYKLDSFNLPENISYDLNGVNYLSRMKYSLTSSIFHFEHYYYRKTRKDLIIPQNVIMRWFKQGCYYSTNRPYVDYTELKSKNKYIYGYFQSEKYFEPYKNQIKEELHVITPISERDRILIDKMQRTNSVGVSIRANKTPENPKVKDNVELGFMTKDYYYQGMIEVAKRIDNPVFFVFADDLDIVKNEYAFPFPVTYVEPEDSAAGLRLLYSCKHFVIANSTFSWWGAYLGNNSNKVVVMPTPWDRYGPLRECIYLDNAITIPCTFED